MPLDVPHDWSYVDIENPHEARYWAVKWEVPVEQVHAAVERVGHDPDVVEEELLGPGRAIEPPLIW